MATWVQTISVKINLSCEVSRFDYHLPRGRFGFLQVSIKISREGGQARGGEQSATNGKHMETNGFAYKTNGKHMKTMVPQTELALWGSGGF